MVAVAFVVLRRIGVGDLGALLHGARLVVVPEQIARSPGELRALLVAEQVTVLHQTTSATTALPNEGLGSVTLLVGDDDRPADPGVGHGADRCAGAGGGVVRAGRLVAFGADRGGGGVVCGRPRGGGRLLAAPRIDGVTVCGVPIRTTGVADVPHRGPGALARTASWSSWAAPTNKWCSLWLGDFGLSAKSAM